MRVYELLKTFSPALIIIREGSFFLGKTLYVTSIGRFSILFLLLFCLLGKIQAQKIGKQYRSKSGMRFTYIQKGEGRKPQNGDKVKIHFTGTTLTGEKFASSRDRNHPIVFQVGAGQVIKGWDELFLNLRAGSVIMIEIPAALAYGNAGLGKVLPNTSVKYDIEFLEILTPPIPYNVLHKDTFELESGLKYIISESSSGKKVTPFKTVKVHYTGYLSDGNIFDSSVEKGFSFEFKIGKSQVIDGWEEGILRMREGEKFRLIIPPKLAYGNRGFPPSIPANATLTYDIELIEIK